MAGIECVGRLALACVRDVCVPLSRVKGLRGVIALPPAGLRYCQRTLTLCCGGSPALAAALRTFTRIWSFL